MDSVHPFLRGVARLRGAMPGPADPAASLPAEAAVPRQGNPTAVPVPYGITRRCIPVLKAGAAGEHGWAPSHTRGGASVPGAMGSGCPVGRGTTVTAAAAAAPASPKSGAAAVPRSGDCRKMQLPGFPP